MSRKKYKQSKEHILKRVKTRKNNNSYQWGSEWKRKQRLAKLGKKLSEEHKKKISLALKGRISGMFGKKATPKQLESLSKGRIKGKKFSEEFRNRRRGAGNPNWRGGVSRDRHCGDEYKKWRSDIFQRDNWTCQTCGARSSVGNQVYLEAHHIKSWIKYKELRYEVNNGVTLCKECHNLIHRKI